VYLAWDGLWCLTQVFSMGEAVVGDASVIIVFPTRIRNLNVHTSSQGNARGICPFTNFVMCVSEAEKILCVEICQGSENIAPSTSRTLSWSSWPSGSQESRWCRPNMGCSAPVSRVGCILKCVGCVCGRSGGMTALLNPVDWKLSTFESEGY